jgi:hypothetical protein
MSSASKSSQLWKVASQVGVDDLPNVLGTGHVAQAVHTEIDCLDVDQIEGWLRNEYLAAVPSRHHSGRAI